MNQVNLRVGGVPEHFNLPWHLACEQNLFQQTGANVTFHEYSGGTGQMANALQDSELDVAVLLFEGAVRRILNGDSCRIVKLFTNTALIWGLHVASDSPIQTVDQTRGKRYAISRYGSGSHLIAIVDAAERGWETDSIEFVKIGNLEGARRSLAAGESDVFLWEKFMTKPLVDCGEFRRVADRVVPWPAFVVAVRDDVLEAHGEIVGNVLKQVSSTCLQLKNDPAAGRVVAERYNLLPEDAQAWLERTEWNQDFEYPAESLRKVYDYLKLLGLLDDPNVDYETAWYSLEPNHRS